MKRQFGLIVAVLSASLPLWAADASQASRPAIQFDTVRLPEQVRNLITSDLNTLDQLQFGPKVDNQFKMLFGGATAIDVERYLLERVHYVGVYSTTNDETQMEPDTYAANLGSTFMSYYLHAVVLGRRRGAHPLVLDFDHTQVIIGTPRVGFIGIGGAYVDPKTSKMDRLDTWVHEARHSDCPRIPSSTDLISIDRADYGHVSAAGLTCTYLHVPCPKGHPLEGELACDVTPWGAYSVGFVFSKNVYQSCTNCTEKQKQEALASATDDFSRLSPMLQLYYRNPNPPAPDLSSFDLKIPR